MVIQVSEGVRIRRLRKWWQVEKIILRNGNPDWAAFLYTKYKADAKSAAVKYVAKTQGQTKNKLLSEVPE